MKILIVSTFFPPLNSIASLRPYSWAKHWTLEGHEVTVLTTPKHQDPSLTLDLPNPGYELLEIPMTPLFSKLKRSYQSAMRPEEIPKTLFQSLKKSSVALFNSLRHKTGIFSSCRMPDFSDLWIRPALKAIQAEQKTWNLLISTSGPYSVHLIAEKIKKQGMASQWIADFRDPWSHNYFFPGLFPFNLIERKLEKKLMRSADAIVTVSTAHAEVMAGKYDAEKVHVIENGFDPSDLDRLSPQSIFKDDQKFRIVHTGTFYSGKCDPTPLFKAIHLLKDKDSDLLNHLEIIFVGFKLDNLKVLIAQHQVEQWVKIQGVVSREDSLKMQRDAHALLFLPLNEMPVDGFLTGKLFEYLFSGTTILAVGGKAVEASQKLLLEAKCGVILTEAETIRDFLKPRLIAICKEKTSPDLDLLNKFDRKFLAHKMLQILNTSESA